MSGLQYTGAFVVQFTTGMDLESGHVAGCVEHIATGKAASFKTSGEFVAFLAQVLKDVQSQRTARQQEASSRRNLSRQISGT